MSAATKFGINARGMLPRGARFCVCDSGRFRFVRNKLLESVVCYGSLRYLVRVLFV